MTVPDTEVSTDAPLTGKVIALWSTTVGIGDMGGGAFSGTAIIEAGRIYDSAIFVVQRHPHLFRNATPDEIAAAAERAQADAQAALEAAAKRSRESNAF